MGQTKIEWTEATWNPITGCSPLSEGCEHCYARRMATRLAGRVGYSAEKPFSVTFHPDRLDEPLHRKKPTRYFVCSMGDLFHTMIRHVDRWDIWHTMYMTPRHTYYILTKRASTARNWIEKYGQEVSPVGRAPVTNIYVGITGENQYRADERLEYLVRTPAAKRFISVEPMLGAVDLSCYLKSLDWVICGAETGPGKREMKLDWARSLRDQCAAAGIPFFFKKDSDGRRTLDGQLWEQYPDA